MDKQSKIIEIKTKLKKVDEASSSPYCFQDNKYDLYQLDDGQKVSVQKSRSIFYGRGNAFREYRSDIDYSDEAKEVTVKIRIKRHQLPKWIPEAVRNLLEEITEEISLVPYWQCDCMGIMLTTNIVYTKEHLEEAISAKKKFIENNIKRVRSGEAVFVGYSQKLFGDDGLDFFCNHKASPCMCDYGTRMYLTSEGDIIDGPLCYDDRMDKDTLNRTKKWNEKLKA
ncbi:MAG: hypothetical protein WC788_04385 [Candidatus Paceibacterota bacterium]|jgi:hypothetical protein